MQYTCLGTLGKTFHLLVNIVNNINIDYHTQTPPSEAFMPSGSRQAPRAPQLFFLQGHRLDEADDQPTQER